MFQEQIGKLALEISGKSRSFPVLALCSTCAPLKFGLPTAIKFIFLELARMGLSFQKVWLIYLNNFKFGNHLKIGCF